MSNVKLQILSKLDYALLLALVLPIFAIMPLLTHAGLPNTADGPVHLMRQVELNQAWQQGNFYPRWGTDLALGHGMPIFSYAPPSLYQLTQIFHLFGLPLDESMKAVLILDFLLYSLGMFLFARRIFGPGPALVAAAVYVYAPYRLREAYIQGNYGQFTGLAFYPLAFWAFHGLITDGRPRYLVAAALSLAGVLLSHNISSMLFAPLFAAYLIFLLILTTYQAGQQAGESTADVSTENYASRFTFHVSRFTFLLIRTIAGGLLGLSLAAIFWLPAFGESQAIKLEGITRGFFDFRDNFIRLSELVSPPLPLDLAAINPEFPLSLGLPQMIGAVLGMFCLVFLVVKAKVVIRTANYEPRTTPHVSRFTHTLFFTFFLLLYAFLTLPQSRVIWETVPLIELTEFPWRMIGPAILCASVLSAAAFSITMHHALPITPHVPHPTPHALRIIRISLLLSIFVTIALNAYYLYPSQFIPWGTPTPAHAFAYEVTSAAIGTTSTGEFLPRSAQLHPRPETLWPDYEAARPPQKIDPASLPPDATVKMIAHLAESDTLQIHTPQEFVATIRTLYWPGWQVYLDGQPADFSITENTGLIQTTIPAGQHMLTLQLESTPLRTIGQWLTIASFFMLVIIIVLGVFKRRKTSEVFNNIFSGIVTRIIWSIWPKNHVLKLPKPGNIGFEGERTLKPASTIVSLKFFMFTTILLIALYLLSRPLAPLFTLQSDPNQPQPADQILQVDFEDQLRLVGMDDLPQTVAVNPPGEARFSITLYWRALQDLETNYSVFVHLDAPNSQTFANVDEESPDNIPTSKWPPGLYLRNPLSLEIPADLPPIRYKVNVGVYNRETGERLSITPDQTTFKLGSIWLVPPQPELSDSPLAHFGPYLTLQQVHFKGETVVLYWQTAQPLDQNYSIFVHLLDAKGNLLAQADGVPYAGLYPLANWLPDQIITDVRPIGSLLDNSERLNAFAIGVYDLTTGERLNATDAKGNVLPDNSFFISVTP
jgi:hypothetical protein